MNNDSNTSKRSVSVHIPTDLWARLVEAADAAGVTPKAYAESALHAWLKSLTDGE